MSQADVMLAEINARNAQRDGEIMKAKYEAKLQELMRPPMAKAAPVAKRLNHKLLLTRSI